MAAPRKSRLLSIAVLVGVVPAVLVACATLVNGTNQDVGISSSPSGAKVVVNGTPMGVTPVTVALQRKASHLVSIELDGYEPFEMNLQRKSSGWVWGNLAWGGLVGIGIDMISGGAYKLTPEAVSGSLSKSAGEEDGVLQVVLVRRPDPSWERIATLVRR